MCFLLFLFRQNISTFCLQNSNFIGDFSIRPAWDAYENKNPVNPLPLFSNGFTGFIF